MEKKRKQQQQQNRACKWKIGKAKCEHRCLLVGFIMFTCNYKRLAGLKVIDEEIPSKPNTPEYVPEWGMNFCTHPIKLN